MDRRAAGALLALAACFAGSAAAPTASNQTALDLYDASSEGCYYNFQHYGEGDRIMTNEPCLNCTCHNRMLMCYLRVCPFTKPIGQDCTVEKREDQCCPIVTCPDVPVDLLTSTSTTSPAEYGGTGVGKLDKYGCSINGKYFAEGSKVPPTPNKPCEHCYCIRNMTTCVMQECTLHVDGCTPIYHKDVCCPVRYSCDHLDDEMLGLDDMSTTVRPTPGFLLTTTTVAPVTQMTQDCVHNDQIFADGTSIKTEKACEHCYCMKGDIVCVVQECGTPMENEGKNCTSQPPREGQCCPDTYICEGDELTTELLPEFSTQNLLEDITTLSPPRRTGDEGSGYRNEPDELSTELPNIPDIEGSGDELVTIEPVSETEKQTPSIIDETFSSTEAQRLDVTEEPIVEAKTTAEPDNELNTVPNDAVESSESSVPKLTTLSEEIITSDDSTTPLDTLRTTKEGLLHTTESSFRKEDESHVPSVTTTQQAQAELTTMQPTTAKEVITQEEKEEITPSIDNDAGVTKAELLDHTENEIEISTSTPSSTSELVKEPSSSLDHTTTEYQATTLTPEKTESSTIDAYENEIEDNTTPSGPGRIPGEGDCLQNGITYRNDSSVPSTNNCQTDCKCISSIVKCDPIICSSPPEYMSNCVATFDSSESCCPTYVCDGSKETLPPQSHSQMSETEFSTPTPVSEDQNVPICSSEDCQSKPSEIPQTSDCKEENCKPAKQTPSQLGEKGDCGPSGCSVPQTGDCNGENCEGGDQTPIQPAEQGDCGPSGCSVPQTSDCKGENCAPAEPAPIQPGELGDCGPAGCSDKTETPQPEPGVPVESCTDEKCKKPATESCTGENCENIPEIPKIESPCEGDSCKHKPTDCGPAGCDISPPIQQPAEDCNNEGCKKPEEPTELECKDESCRRKGTTDVESKLPSDCTDTECLQQKPESPDVSISESVSSTTPTAEIQSEITSPQDVTSIPVKSPEEEEELLISRTTTDKSATELSTDAPKLSETTKISESTQDTTAFESPELPSVTQADIITEVPATETGGETVSLEKATTVSDHLSTVSEQESTEKVTIEYQDHKSEIPQITKLPESSVSEQYDHSTPAPDVVTKDDTEQSPEDIDQKLTTLSSPKDDTESETHMLEEATTVLPELASESTKTTPEKKVTSTFVTADETTESAVTEKSKLPEEISYPTTETSLEFNTNAQTVSDVEEKQSTIPLITPEDKTDTNTEAGIKQESDVNTSDVSKVSQDISTTLQDTYTDKPDKHSQEPELSVTTMPELYTNAYEVPSEMSTIKVHQEEEQITTTISQEPESETDMPQQEDNIIPVEPEINTEDTSIVKEQPATIEYGFTTDLSVETEAPDYIPVHPSLPEETIKPEFPDKPSEGTIIPETIPEYITSTTQRIRTTAQDALTEKDTNEIVTTSPDIYQSQDTTELTENELSTNLPEKQTVSSVHVPDVTTTGEELLETVTDAPVSGEDTKSTETPESHIKETVQEMPASSSEATFVDTTDNQVSAEDEITRTGAPTVISESSEASSPVQDDKTVTKIQEPVTESDEPTSKLPVETTEQYEHPDTIPDMIELVEHQPMEISTISPITEEITTIGTEKSTATYVGEVSQEHGSDESLITVKPDTQEVEQKPKDDETKLETSSPEDSASEQPVTQDNEQKIVEFTTKHPDSLEIETAKPTFVYHEDGTPDQEYSTEKIESSVTDHEVKEKPLTEEPETIVTEQGTTRREESSTETEISDTARVTTSEVESATNIPKVDYPESGTTAPEPSIIDEKEPEKVSSPVTSSVTSSDLEQMVTLLEESSTEGPAAPVTEIVPQKELVTKISESEEQMTEKLSTEKTTDIDHEPEKDIETTATKSPTLETELTTKRSEEIETEATTRLPQTSETESEIQPDKELSTDEPEIVETPGVEREGTPESTTEKLDTPEIEKDKPESAGEPSDQGPTKETQTPEVEHEATEKPDTVNITELPIEHEGALEQGSMTKEPETSTSDDDSYTLKPTTVKSSENEDFSKSPDVLEISTQQESEPGTELSTEQPEGSKVEPGKEYTTEGPKATGIEHELKPDSEATIAPSESPVIEHKTDKPEVNEIDSEIKPDSDSFTTPSDTFVIEPETGSSTERTEPEVSEPDHEPKPSESPEIGTDKESSTDRSVIPDSEPTDKTQESESSEESSTDRQQIEPSKESSAEQPDVPEIEGAKPEKELTTETPEVSEQETKPENEHSTERTEVPEIDETKPDSESSTGLPEFPEIEEEKKPEKVSTEQPKVTDFEQDTKPYKEPATEEPEVFQVEQKPDVEFSTEPDASEIEHKPEIDTTTAHPDVFKESSSEQPDSSVSETEKTPDKEHSTEQPDLPVTETEKTPDSESSSEQPEVSETETERTADKESSSEHPEVSETETEKTPEKESSGEQPEISVTETEKTPEKESSSEQPEVSETETEKTPERESSSEQPEVSEIETEKMPDKESSSEQSDISLAETEKTPEKESSSEQPEVSEIETEKTPEKESSGEQPEISVTETEKTPEKESSSEQPEVSETETEKTPERESSSEQPEISETETEKTPEKESSSEQPEVSETETEKTPEKESSGEQPEISETETEKTPERESSSEQPDVSEIETEKTPEKESSEQSDVSEIETEETPDKETSSEQPDVSEIETEKTPDKEASSEQPEVSETTDKESSSEQPDTSEIEQKLKPEKESSTERSSEEGVKPADESSTEGSAVSTMEDEIIPGMVQTEHSEMPEKEVKPDQESSTEGTQTTEPEKQEVSKEPESLVTEGAVTAQTSIDIQETTESELKPGMESSTRQPEPQEIEGDHVKPKPVEQETSERTTTESSKTDVFETTLSDKEIPEKSTDVVSVERTTTMPLIESVSSDVQKDEVTTKHPLEEKPTTADISDVDKLSTPEVLIPVQTEHETEKPFDTDKPKDITAPEEEFLAVTTKATTPKAEEETSTQSSLYDKYTKPQDKPATELPSSAVPEIPKPGFNEVPATDDLPAPEEDGHFPPSGTGTYGGQETDYEDENQPFGPGTCRYGGKVYVSAQQIPRDDPCDFCFCFRSDIICLQQSCPPPIHGCHEEPIQGFCCPRYECPVSMANTLNITTTTTTTTTTLPPHFPLNAYQGAAQRRGCQIKGHTYKVGEVVRASSGPCLHCTCGGDGQMKCDPKACTPEPMLRQMIAAAVSSKRRR